MIILIYKYISISIILLALILNSYDEIITTYDFNGTTIANIDKNHGIQKFSNYTLFLISKSYNLRY